MGRSPAYQHYVKEWLVGTMSMTLEQQGAYKRLLDHQWDNGGVVPNSCSELAQLVGVSPEVFLERLWPALKSKFPKVRGGRANRKLEAVYAEQQAFKQRQSESGKRGAAKRWHGNPNGEPIAPPMRPQWPEHGSASASASASPSERRKAFASQRSETPGSDRRREEAQGPAHISDLLPKVPAA